MKMKRLMFCLAFSAIAVVSCKKKDDDSSAPASTLAQIPSDAIQVSGDVEGTWEKGKTYAVTGPIYIQTGKSLTIQEGVTVLMDTTIKPEVIIKGNFYSLGTPANPIKFTVLDGEKTESTKFGALWGGLIASPDCGEIVVLNTILEYGGAVVTANSASLKEGLYKNTEGERVPAIYASNVNGKIVVMNSTIRHYQEDAIYLEGGQVIIANNTFYTTGLTNGEAVNLKSGVGADVCYNMIYSPNTNGFKLSNTGGKTQDSLFVYNNTVVNAGWRRPDIKGGSVWLEKGVFVKLANNLLANDRFGVKHDSKNPEDSRTKLMTTHYYGYTTLGVQQFQPSTDILAGSGDIISAVAGQNDPMFVNYPLSTDVNNSTFDTSWDFHLQSGAPGLSKGVTDDMRRFPTGLTVGGQLYTAPLPSSYIGAFGTH